MIRPPLPSHARVVPVVAGALIQGTKCLVGRRRPGGSAGGLWEFPGGKVEAFETPEAALIRELKEELDLSVEVGAFVGRGISETTERLLVLDLYLVTLTCPKARPTPLDHVELRFIAASDLQTLTWAPPDVPLLDLVRAHLLNQSAS